jgi:hypothetical protein
MARERRHALTVQHARAAREGAPPASLAECHRGPRRAKKSPYREDTGIPDTSATLCLWQRMRLAGRRVVPEFIDCIPNTQRTLANPKRTRGAQAQPPQPVTDAKGAADGGAMRRRRVAAPDAARARCWQYRRAGRPAGMAA